MKFTNVAAALSAVTLASAASPAATEPFKGLPLGNGFPKPLAGIDKIQENAGGSLPNAALPTSLSAEAKATFQLVGMQETFEVAYFTDLLKNITNNVPGYQSKYKKYLMRNFRRIRAQEEMHATVANLILQSAGEKPVGFCQYVFPVTSLDSAIALAKTFTDVVLGVIPAVQAFVATDPDLAPFIPALGSILAQEGEQVGYFRAYENKPSSSAPFLTGGAAQFAASALKLFLVPGTCPVMPDIPTFPAITILGTPSDTDTEIAMEVEGTVDSSMSVAYLSGQHTPYTGSISSIDKVGKMTRFKAQFPFKKGGFAKGLTIAAITKGKSSFSSPDEVASSAVYGPGLIEIG